MWNIYNVFGLLISVLISVRTSNKWIKNEEEKASATELESNKTSNFITCTGPGVNWCQLLLGKCLETRTARASKSKFSHLSKIDANLAHFDFIFNDHGIKSFDTWAVVHFQYLQKWEKLKRNVCLRKCFPNGANWLDLERERRNGKYWHFVLMGDQMWEEHVLCIACSDGHIYFSYRF